MPRLSSIEFARYFVFEAFPENRRQNQNVEYGKEKQRKGKPIGKFSECGHAPHEYLRHKGNHACQNERHEIILVLGALNKQQGVRRHYHRQQKCRNDILQRHAESFERTVTLDAVHYVVTRKGKRHEQRAYEQNRIEPASPVNRGYDAGVKHHRAYTHVCRPKAAPDYQQVYGNAGSHHKYENKQKLFLQKVVVVLRFGNQFGINGKRLYVFGVIPVLRTLSARKITPAQRTVFEIFVYVHFAIFAIFHFFAHTSQLVSIVTSSPSSASLEKTSLSMLLSTIVRAAQSTKLSLYVTALQPVVSLT